MSVVLAILLLQAIAFGGDAGNVVRLPVEPAGPHAQAALRRALAAQWEVRVGTCGIANREAEVRGLDSALARLSALLHERHGLSVTDEITTDHRSDCEQEMRYRNAVIKYRGALQDARLLLDHRIARHD